MKRPSTIPAEMSLQGGIEGEGDIVVLGRVEGDIHVGGALLVEEGGAVKGDVRARGVTIRGTVLGDAYGTDLVRVDEGGRVVGDLTAPRVKIAEGARFRGRMHMDQSAPAPAPHAYGDDSTFPPEVTRPKKGQAVSEPARARQPPDPRMPKLRRRTGRRRIQADSR